MAAVASVNASPCAEAPGALDVGRQVGVADGEPARLAVALEHGVGGHRVAADAPAAFGVDQAAERVEQRVDVGRDVEAVQLEVVADVGDDGELDAVGSSSAKPCASFVPPVPPARSVTFIGRATAVTRRRASASPRSRGAPCDSAS